MADFNWNFPTGQTEGEKQNVAGGAFSAILNSFVTVFNAAKDRELEMHFKTALEKKASDSLKASRTYENFTTKGFTPILDTEVPGYSAETANRLKAAEGTNTSPIVTTPDENYGKELKQNLSYPTGTVMANKEVQNEYPGTVAFAPKPYAPKSYRDLLPIWYDDRKAILEGVVKGYTDPVVENALPFIEGIDSPATLARLVKSSADGTLEKTFGDILVENGTETPESIKSGAGFQNWLRDVGAKLGVVKGREKEYRFTNKQRGDLARLLKVQLKIISGEGAVDESIGTKSGKYKIGDVILGKKVIGFDAERNPILE